MTRNNTSYGTQGDRDSTTEFSPTTPDEAGITPIGPGSSLEGRVITGHNPVTAVWQNLVEDPEILNYILLAARKAVTGLTYSEALEFVDTVGVSDNPHMGHYPRRSICLLTWKPAVAKHSGWRLIRIVRELGTGASTVDEIHSMAKLFRFVHYNNPHIDIDIETPTLNVQIEYEDFKQLNQSQRSDICKLFRILGEAFDIQLVTTQTAQAFLKQYHHDELPYVSEWSITSQSAARTGEALVELDPNGTSATILGVLADAPDETLSYSDLYETIEKSDSRVRQCIKKLREYGLITSFGSPNNKKASLLDTGSEVLESLQRRCRMSSPPEDSSELTPNPERHRREYSRPDSVCLESEDCSMEISREGRRPVAADNHVRSPQPQQQQRHRKSNSGYPTGRMRPSMRDAIAACGDESGTITIVDDDIDHLDSSTQLFAVDNVNSEVIVSSHATTPLDYTVGIAMALAHPKLITEVLSETALSAILDDTPVEILSWARQIAHVPFDEVEPSALQNALLEWRNEIKELTRRLKREDYGTGEFDCRNDLLSEILRQAHGLAGCIIHLLDEAGIHVVRDIRIPSGLNSSKIGALAESIAHSITVQSRYKSFSAHRQLFEARAEFRANSFTPEVDAADPFGTLIGALVMRGGSATRIKPDLATKLETYEPVEDAPEFAIPITIRDAARDNVKIAAERVLKRKNINLTRDALSVLDGVVDSPFGVTRALQYLDTASDRRIIESSELRYVLQQLSADDLLSDLPRSVSRIVMTLLYATEPITQTQLANQADVTPQTIRNHEEAMVSTGIVQYERKASGTKEWRVILSFDWEQDDTYPSVNLEDAFQKLITEMCECSGTCFAQQHCKRDDDHVSCPVLNWRQVQVAIQDTQELNEEMMYEILLGDSPKQTSILNTGELTDNTNDSSDSDKSEKETYESDCGDPDEEIDTDFSGISIPGSIDDCSDNPFSESL